MKKALFLFIALCSSASYASWDDGAAIASGVVTAVHVANGGNYDFRVYLANSPKMCNGGDRWAYLNESDSNYAVYVSTILSAKATKSPVTIYSNTKAGTSHCHIGYLVSQ